MLRKQDLINPFPENCPICSQFFSFPHPALIDSGQLSGDISVSMSVTLGLKTLRIEKETSEIAKNEIHQRILFFLLVHLLAKYGEMVMHHRIQSDCQKI